MAAPIHRGALRLSRRALQKAAHKMALSQNPVLYASMSVGADNHTNIQVSSRTDRGVHAWRNTLQVDIRPRLPRGSKHEADAKTQPKMVWCTKNLVHGLNFYLTRLSNYPSEATDVIDCDENDMNANNLDVSHASTLKSEGCLKPLKGAQTSSTYLHGQSMSSGVRILSSAIASDRSIPNPNYDPNRPEHDATNPKIFPWDVRFTATRRTYAYQILHSSDGSDSHSDGEKDEQEDIYTLRNHYQSDCCYSEPFEHDRVWKIHEKERTKQTGGNVLKSLDIDAMNRAGQHLVGSHDFTSFRGKGCERSSPIVTLEDIWVGQEKYHDSGCGGVLSGVLRRTGDGKKSVLPSLRTHKSLRLVTVVITGKSFLYHQVRNIVACLVDVGRGKLKPNDVKDILEKRDRSCAPGMAPAQGLFLVDVEHGGFRF